MKYKYYLRNYYAFMWRPQLFNFNIPQNGGFTTASFYNHSLLQVSKVWGSGSWKTGSGVVFTSLYF